MFSRPDSATSFKLAKGSYRDDIRWESRDVLRRTKQGKAGLGHRFSVQRL